MKPVNILTWTALAFFSGTESLPTAEQRRLYTVSLIKSLCFGYRLTLYAIADTEDWRSVRPLPQTKNCSFVYVMEGGRKRVSKIIEKACKEEVEAEEDESQMWGDHVEGDMILPDGSDRAGIPNPLYKWEKRRVYYTFDCSFSEQGRRLTNQVIEEIQQKTCIRFINNEYTYDSSRDFIEIGSKYSGCYSSVGRAGGNQILNLGRGCVSYRIILHELVHALGFNHEHIRRDRDSYVRVNFTNIPAGQQHNFRKREDSKSFGSSYDYSSIMHYSRKAFAINSRYDTLTPTRSTGGVEIGAARNLSFADALQLNRYYDCTSYLFYQQK